MTGHFTSYETRTNHELATVPKRPVDSHTVYVEAHAAPRLGSHMAPRLGTFSARSLS